MSENKSKENPVERNRSADASDNEGQPLSEQAAGKERTHRPDTESPSRETLRTDDPEEGADATETKTPPSPLEKLEAEVGKLAGQLKESEQKRLREAADFENMKRRLRSDFENRAKFATLPLGEGFIACLDDLERAIGHAEKQGEGNESPENDEFVKGIGMIRQQLMKNLEDNHYARIEPEGEPFDPEKHEAIGMVPTDAMEEGRVFKVFKVGYMLHERIVRPAMVQVAQKTAATSKTGSDESEGPDSGQNGG